AFTYDPLVGVRDDINNKPEVFYLYNNYPNPFNLTTAIKFDLAVSSRVEITIYNSLGQLMRRLFSQELVIGSHEVFWNGLTDYGDEVSSGTYFVVLKAYIKDQVNEVFTKSLKIMLLK